VTGERKPLPPTRQLIFLFGFLLLRLALVILPLRNPEGGILLDSTKYIALASSLVNTGRYAEATGQDVIWPPGYPVFVAVASAWSQTSPAAVALAQLGLTCAIGILLVTLTSQLANPGAARTAGWLYALSPSAALWALTVMSETLFTALLVASALAWVTALRRRSAAWGWVCGILLGMGALVRPLGLVLVPLWCLVTLIGVSRLGRRRWATRLGMTIGLGAIVVAVPWAARNLIVHGQFTFSGVAGRTFYNFNIAQVKATAEHTTRDLAASQIGASGSEFRDSLNVISDYPFAFLYEQAKGVFRTALGLEAGSWARLLGYPEALRGGLGVVSTMLAGDITGSLLKVESLLSSPQTAPILVIAAVAEAHSFVLYALLIVLLAYGRERAGGIVGVGLGLSVALLMLVPAAAGQARFRIPAEPFLAFLAASGWQVLRTKLSKRKPNGLGSVAVSKSQL